MKLHALLATSALCVLASQVKASPIDDLQNLLTDAPAAAAFVESITDQLTFGLENNDAGTQYMVGKLFHQYGDQQQATYYLQQASAHGSHLAQAMLQSMQSRGMRTNNSQLRALQADAEKGAPEAMFKLGRHYEQGIGVPQDYEQALHWYEEAASRGSTEAKHQLGLAHAYGRGVQRNPQKAFMWFNLAGAEGLQESIDARVRLASQMKPRDVLEAQRLSREWMQTNY